MYTGKTIFSQVMEHLPLHRFRRCVERYHGNYKIKTFSCLEQFYCMAFAQLTYRESLRDIEACLRSQGSKVYHMGIRSNVSRNTLANANEKREWRIYADFAQVLIHVARRLYIDDNFGVDLDETVYALDSTTIDLCLSVFPWAQYRAKNAALKLHTQMDLRGSIPTFIDISGGKVHDVNLLDLIIPEPGSFYIMDRAYLDFARLFSLNQNSAFFIIRPRENFTFRRLYSHPTEKDSGIQCDQTITLSIFRSHKKYPDKLRRIKCFDPENMCSITFLTNNFRLPASTIAQLYRCRWNIEIFFKWIKQNLRIKSFLGTSVNAVKTQIWIAISTYVLVAIIKKRLNLNMKLYTILQILSVTVFEKTPLIHIFTDSKYKNIQDPLDNQMNLFN